MNSFLRKICFGDSCIVIYTHRNNDNKIFINIPILSHTDIKQNSKNMFAVIEYGCCCTESKCTRIKCFFGKQTLIRVIKKSVRCCLQTLQPVCLEFIIAERNIYSNQIIQIFVSPKLSSYRQCSPFTKSLFFRSYSIIKKIRISDKHELGQRLLIWTICWGLGKNTLLFFTRY